MLDVVLYLIKGGLFISLFVLVHWIEALAMTVGWIITKWLLFRFVLGLRRMTQTEAVYCRQPEGGSSYVMGVIILDRCSLKESEVMFTKFVSFPKTYHMRMCMVEVLGEMYWVNEAHFSVRKHLHLLDVPQVNTIEEVLSIMAHRMQEPLNKALSPWEVCLIEKYQEHKSAMFIKWHHAIGDGISLQYYISHSSESKPHILQRFVKSSLCRDILMCLLFPVLFPYAMIKMSCGMKQSHILNHGNRPLAGVKRVGVTKNFAIRDLKAVAHHFGITINDLVLTVVLSCLKMFIHNEYAFDQNDVPFGIPFNLKEEPGEGKHINCANDFAVFFYQFPLPSIQNIETDSSAAFKAIVQKTRELKNNILPYTFKLIQGVNELFPQTIGRCCILQVTNRCPIIFTNVAGSRTPLVFSGRLVSDLLYLAPSLGHNCINICISSYNEKLNVLSNSDVNRMERPDVLMAMVSEMLSQYVQRYAHRPPSEVLCNSEVLPDN